MDWHVSLSVLAASVATSVVITVFFCWLLILWAGRRYPQLLLYLLVLARMDDRYYPLHAEPGEDLSAVMRRRRGHREYEEEGVEMESLLNDSGTKSRGEPVYDSLLQLHSLSEDDLKVTNEQQQQQPANPTSSSRVVAPLQPVPFSYGAVQHHSSTPSPPPPTATADASSIRQLSSTVPSPASPNTTPVAHPTPSVSSPSSPPPTAAAVPSAFSPGCLEEWSAQQDLQASTQQYIMVKRIGWGGFSSVYQVQRRTDHHLFALKYLMLWCEEDREAAMAECHTLIRLQGHPNIVKVVDAFTKYEWSTASSSAPSSPAEAALTTVRSSSSSGALGLVKMPAEERQRNLNLHRAPYPPRPRQQQLYRHPHYGAAAAAAFTSSSSASSSFSSEGSSCYLEPLQPVVQQQYTSSVSPSATSGLVGAHSSSHPGVTHSPLIHRRAPPPLPSSTMPLSTRHHHRRRHQQQRRFSTTTATLSGTTTHSETPSTNSSSAISSSCKVMRPLPSQSAAAVGNLQQQQQLFVSGYTSPTPPATLHYTNVMFTTGRQQQQRGVAPGSAEKPTGTSSSCRSGGGSSSTLHIEGAEGEGVDSGPLTATSSPAPPPPPKFLKPGQLVYAGAAEDNDGMAGSQTRTTTAATANTTTTTTTTAATVPVLASPSIVLKGSHTRHHREDPSSPIFRDEVHHGDDLDAEEAAAHLGSGAAIPRRVGYLCLIMAYYPLGDISQYIHRRQMMTSVGSGFSAGSSTHPHHHHLPPLKSLTEPQILSVAYQIADALHHLHSGPHPVVHRDLKPENVLLKGSLSDADDGRVAVADDSIHGSCCSSSRHHHHHHHGSSSSMPSASTPSYLPVVVSDFGLTLSTEQARHRHSGGTQPYIAPEVRSSGASPASDVWSLGCVLYAIATARLDRHNVRVMCDDAKREGFVSIILNDILSHQYSLNFASFVVSLLAVAPSRRPTAANIMTYFMVRGEGLEKEVLFDLSSDFFCSVSDL